MTPKTILLPDQFQSDYSGRIIASYKPNEDWKHIHSDLIDILEREISEGKELWYSSYKNDVILKLTNCDGKIHPDIVEASEVMYLVIPIQEDNDENSLDQPGDYDIDKNPINPSSLNTQKTMAQFLEPLMQHQFDQVFNVVSKYDASDISLDDLRDLCMSQVVYGYIENVDLYHQLDIEERHELSDGTLHKYSSFYVVEFKQPEAVSDTAVSDTNSNAEHSRDAMALYEMELDQNLSLGDCVVKRVPGGWIYTVPVSDDMDQAVFVPFDNEFQQRYNEGCVLCGHKKNA